MENKIKRPVVIWLALAYIAVTVLVTLKILYSKLEAFKQSEIGGTGVVILALAFCGLMIFTFNAILERSKWGQGLSILCFALTGIFAINNTVILFNWPDTYPQNGLLFAQVIAISRILISFFMAFAIGASNSAKEYFSDTSKSPASDSPPSFDS